ncbi:MAG TPA: response regulator [Bacteroidota bacterium]
MYTGTSSFTPRFTYFRFMDLDNDRLPEISPRDAFLSAKAEYFLDQALECFAMARYHAALKMLSTVAGLEPENQVAAELLSRIHERLRLVTRPLHADWLDTTQAPGVRRPEVILVVDQDERVLTGLNETFRRYGFPVVGAGTVQEATEVLSTCVPDVVLSEVNFESGPRGLELFQQIKSLQPEQDRIFLFLTSRLERNAEIAGRRLGVDDYILKPFDPDVVAATVMRCLARRKAPVSQPSEPVPGARL